jgi:hypothetical protein
VLKQLLVITRTTYQARDIPFRHRFIMKSKAAAAQRARHRRVIVVTTTHPHRQLSSYVQNKRLFQVVCGIDGVCHAKWTDEGKSRSNHVTRYLLPEGVNRRY